VESLDLAQERLKVLRVVRPEGGPEGGVGQVPRTMASLKVVLRGGMARVSGSLAEPGPVLGKRQRKLTPAMAEMKQEQLMKQMVKQQKNGTGGGAERSRGEEERDPAVDDSPPGLSSPGHDDTLMPGGSRRLESKRGMVRESQRLAKKQGGESLEVQLPSNMPGASPPHGTTPRALLRPKRVIRTPRRISSGDYVGLNNDSEELFEEPPQAPRQVQTEAAGAATLADLAGLAAEAQRTPIPASPSPLHVGRAGAVLLHGSDAATAESSGVAATLSWIQEGPFQEYAPLFQFHRITWEILPYLTRDDLRDMGIHLVGPRRALLMALHSLPKKPKKSSPRRTRRGVR